ncbi:39S ribosomal protein L3, mitochondrial isoform X2 [Agrilus planipennis]|uniref:Large ribosomal subunit protein uL3m n=1 Tax=Agrilus planipennis TaxID=224129 RepID=A0A7F5R9Y7_AGRPL|nr:39S ribosomal protein L3, mitochondrial isoform X1 [Agrilus planipennis]XP_025832765.1 39S ribosomal protein L3, mitochondrial isoform X2 [Agrilus planipennis]
MAFIISNVFNKSSNKSIVTSFQIYNITQIREKRVVPKPKLRHPTWFTHKNRVIHDDFVTADNVGFLKEVVEDQRNSLIPKKAPTNIIDWHPGLRRTGVIARKIGNIPLWLKDGTKIFTTMLEVLDNHVIRCYSPEEYNSPRVKPTLVKNKKGCLLLGAIETDPILLTKEYCGLFKDSGVLPKKVLGRFFVSPEALLQPGTPITIDHYRVGNYVDVRGKTIDRGFQGVMKRHGFSGMPASHGVTKTHRRGGNIGGGGEKGRVWPGTKMPGHMGNRYRVAKGLKILRINRKYNVMWVMGMGIPGETNSIVYIYDTVLPLRKPSAALPFPTYFHKDEDVLPEEFYDENLHNFSDPSIVYK